MQATLFVLAGIAGTHYGVRTVEQLGVAAAAGRHGWRAPSSSSALSMIGIPPTGGFFGKWYIVLGAIQAGQYAAVARGDSRDAAHAGVLRRA